MQVYLNIGQNRMLKFVSTVLQVHLDMVFNICVNINRFISLVGAELYVPVSGSESQNQQLRCMGMPCVPSEVTADHAELVLH